MEVDMKTLERIAVLAKLQFEEDEKAEILKDMNKMLGFVNKLKELDTEGEEPLIYLMNEERELREDKVKMEISQQQALKNAPEKDSDFIHVPKVLSKPGARKEKKA